MTPDQTLLTTREVAEIYRVGMTTVRRWADSGLITSLTTPGGRRRYPALEIARQIERAKATAVA